MLWLTNTIFNSDTSNRFSFTSHVQQKLVKEPHSITQRPRLVDALS